MKDKRNRHGAMSKSSSEQHFRKSAAITFIVCNFWSPTPSATGSYGRQAGWLAGLLADEIQVNFEIFKVGCRSKYSTCCQGTASFQPYQCIPAGFFG